MSEIKFGDGSIKGRNGFLNKRFFKLMSYNILANDNCRKNNKSILNSHS